MKRTLLLVLCGLMALWLAACSAARLDPGVYVYPMSTPDDGAMEDFRQQLEEAERANLAGYRVELKLYSTQSSLDEVMGYYNGVLKGWKQVERLDNAQDSGMTLVKWTDNRQIFMIMYGQDPFGTGRTALYTERVFQE